MRYAEDVKNEQGFLTTADEMRVFIGILLLNGYHSNTYERDYWLDAEDLGEKCRVTKPLPKVEISFTLCKQWNCKFVYP
ncbi:hypothetical protein TNCT_521821 [Trichonephila clavata]|uniref:PiggyBac transposable element-derived protein domain-containing protein n=1 Tax=Trichonephila clavata TaxID=2740835 RepID=A0A8X6GKD9_TRICU|nr:hypothetical protein TNCT_521821 [Trichonephila clavata]